VAPYATRLESHALAPERYELCLMAMAAAFAPLLLLGFSLLRRGF
jgi:hypothetical protein